MSDHLTRIIHRQGAKDAKMLRESQLTLQQEKTECLSFEIEASVPNAF